jgi:rubrerythrin
MKQFNGMEILNLLVESEGKVAALYTDLSEKITNEKARNLFLKLAGDELNHQKMYEALMADLDQDLTIELEDED